jgi:methyl-accepting chemotaxis protein
MAQGILVTIFIFIAAIAIVLQAFAMLGIYLNIGKMQKQVEDIREDMKHHLDPLAQGLSEIIAMSREPLRTVTSNLADISQVLRDRTHNVDALMDDLVDKTRLQVIRADQVITDVLGKVEKTSSALQESILAPVQEVSAVIKGVRSGLDFLFTKRRTPGASEVPQDEQMFI